MKQTLATFMNLGLTVLAIGFFLYGVGWLAISGAASTTTTTITQGINKQTQTPTNTTP